MPPLRLRQLVALLTLAVALGPTRSALAQAELPRPTVWQLAGSQQPLSILVDNPAQKSVVRAAGDLADDVTAVSGQPVRVCLQPAGLSASLLIVGVIGQSPVIDRLVAEGKLDVSGVTGAWESNVTAVVADPLPGILRALVVAGSDRRGAIYGVYGLSEEIGVSPWHWWADVPAPRHSEVFVSGARRVLRSPAVKYRGIFLNDEDWGLRVWASKTFDPQTGAIGPKTYAKVFGLLLRLRANTLWPAMHPGTRAFNAFPEDKVLADEFGIVMGSSHAEPMLRDNVDEWKHETQGDFDYGFNKQNVLKYWDERVRENGRYENIYTLGMRGIHDGPMQGGGTIDERAAKLAAIMQDQRAMLAHWVRPDVDQVPQMFCPYKEVLPIYEHAPQIVPDDVTLVWPDENFGYIQHFSSEAERARSGGSGVYYHVSYWGRPYDYLWICSTPPAEIAEEMEKAYAYGSRRIWILNVGDLKPAEIDMEFFLRLAWDPSTWIPESGQHAYLRERIARDLGPQHAEEIAAILDEYYRLNFWRKPEHMSLDPKVPPLARPQFTLNGPASDGQQRIDAFRALARNAQAIGASLKPDQQDAYFEYVLYPVVGAALMNEKGICLGEYQTRVRTGQPGADEFLERARQAQASIDHETAIYNDRLAGGKWRGMMSDAPRAQGVFDPPQPMAAPNPLVPPPAPLPQDGRVAFAATSATLRVPGAESQWRTVTGLGYSGAALVALPETAPSRSSLEEIQARAPRLEYPVTITEAGTWEVILRGPPTWPVDRATGLRYAVAFDDEVPQLVERPRYRDEFDPNWQEDVLRNAAFSHSRHQLTAGRHTLKVWRVDPGMILDSFLVVPAGAPRGGYEWPADRTAGRPAR